MINQNFNVPKIIMKTTNKKAMDRIQEIDFTKGILIIFMVIYHTLNAQRVFPHQFMAFLPASFIMITGFIITQIYFPKYGLDIAGLRTRLAVRSLKLLLIFTVLNLVAFTIGPKYHYGKTFELENFFGEWLEIYILGRPRMVAFGVLMPISYTLLLSIVIPRIQSVTPYIIKLCALIIFGVCILMENYGNSIYNIDLISAGFIGMTIGLLPLTLINGLAKPWIIISLLFVFLGSFFFSSGDDYVIQIFSTIISLLIIYAIGCRINLQSWFSKQTVLLGQYSLLSYIIQIIYLQIYRIVAARWNIDNSIITPTIIFVTLITWVTVIIVDQGRQKYEFVNVLYKKVFA
jgi:uncharacterized membrane protein